MKANRKTIAIIIATLVLVAAATTGVVMYLNDDGTSRAGFDENEPSISEVNTNTGTTEENNQNNSGENAGNTENPANNNEPGNLPEAGENANQGTTANRGGTTGANTNQGTTTTTGNANVPNQEYVTERIEEVERQITEDLLVGWTPLSITSAYSTNGIGIYKPDLEIVKVASTTDGNNSVVAGDALTYAMAVKNNGNEDITGLTISDIIPDQTTFIEGTIYGNGTYNKELNKIVWKVDVKAGEVVAVGFAVAVNENATGTIKNVGTIDGKNTEEVVNPVITSEKLAEVYRDKQPIEGPANIGDQIKYTIVAKNTGDVDATVVMKDTIPANTELVSPIEIAGEEIDEATMNAGKTVTVPAGETVELTFTVEVKAIEGSIKNIATVGTTTPDTETKTANLEMTKTVSAEKDGEYSKNVTLKVGETAYFKIELKNTGSEDLEVTMTDIMNDKNITLYDGDKEIAQTVTVPAGTTKTLTATYTMQQEDIDNQQRLKNIATATTPVTPVNEDTAEVTPEKAEPGIKVEKTTVSVTSKGITTEVVNGKAPMVRAGDIITYTITVTNTGNTTLKDIEVIDTTLDVNYGNTTIEAGTPIDTISSLAPTKYKKYTVTYTVTPDDIENKTQIENAATATGSKEVPSTPVPVNPNVTISGTKTWADADNQDGKRPEKITVNLLANGNKEKSQEVTAASVNSEGKWTYTFADLPKYADGEEIAYTVTEETVAEYTTEVNGYNITNTHTPETISVSGTKTWIDANNQDGKRPEKITVNLLANGNKEKSQEVTAASVNSEGKWTYTFADLPKYENGTEITYTVTEETVAEYTTDIDGYNITNTHTPETTSISGTKTWVGDSDGNRPASITVKVMNGSQLAASKKVTAKDNWTYEFTGLPKYANGEEINYTIEEVKVSGYETTINGYDITNTYIKQVTINKKEYPVKAIDVVLVLDVSSSMKDHSRIANAQKAACNFIDGMFPAGTTGTGSTVTVVTFGNDAKTLGKATNETDAGTLKAAVNGITIPDSVGTNVQAALAHTNTVLDGLNNTNKFVVFLGDGAPTPSYIIVHGGYVWNDRKHDWEWTENYEEYNQSNFPNNTETNIKKEANTLKGKTTGVYTIGFGMDKLLDSREYWSHYTECGVANCKDPNHIIVNAGDVNRGKSYHWESAKSYATRILRDIIADKATAGKQYYYTADDSADSIVKQFMDVLKSISTTTTTINTAKQTVKIEVTGGTVNTTQDIIITINGTEHKCKISELPKYGVSYTKTSSEEYFTWDVSGYTTESLEIEYTIK